MVTLGSNSFQYVFDFFWPMEPVRRSSKFQITKQLGTDKISMPLNSKATVRFHSEPSGCCRDVEDLESEFDLNIGPGFLRNPNPFPS